MARKIDDVINSLLNDDERRNALDFTAYLKSKGLTLDESEQYWEVKHNGRTVCAVWVDGSDNIPGPWTIWSAEEPDSWAYWSSGEESGKRVYAVVDERTKKIAWANVNICGKCGGCDKPGGTRKNVLGKDFDGLCNATMQFVNPGAEAIACAKKMVDIRMADIEHVKSRI